jgi:hypothetical protein
LHHAQPGFRDGWVAVADLPGLRKHPWTFSQDNEHTRELIEKAPHTPLRKLLADEIGYGCITRTDEMFIQPPWVLRRFGIEAGHIRPLGTGETLRDWSRDELPLIIFPYDSGLRPFDPEKNPKCIAFLEPYRDTLENV